MATDRIVTWKEGETLPSSSAVGVLLKDYLGEAAKEVFFEPNQSRWYAELGKTSNPYANLPNPHDIHCDSARRIEVYVDHEHVDVMTRAQDPFTSAVAQGFAELVSWTWGGDLEKNQGLRT